MTVVNKVSYVLVHRELASSLTRVPVRRLRRALHHDLFAPRYPVCRLCHRSLERQEGWYHHL
jgi:hypothetical protein